MKWFLRKQGALALLAVATLGTGFSRAEEPRSPVAAPSAEQQAAQEKLDAAREKQRDIREEKKENRKQGEENAREDRQDTRQARQETRAARREFRAETIRSADIGMWLRRLVGNRTTVADVTAGGVAAGAGFREGDQIVSVNGQPVATEREFVDALFRDEANEKQIPVVVEREGKPVTLSIQPKALVEEFLAGPTDHLLDYGIVVDDRGGDLVVVQKVLPRSPAFYAGLRGGDVIVGFRGQRIAALADFIRTLANSTGGPAKIEVNRNNQPRELEIEVPQVETHRTLKPNTEDPGLNSPARAQPNSTPVPNPAPGRTP